MVLDAWRAQIRSVAGGTPLVPRQAMRTVLILVASFGLVTHAFAEDADEKSPSAAVALSVGVTTAGVITLLASDSESMSMVGLGAMYLGPSTGQWYAGEVGGFGLAARAVGAVAVVHGFSQILQSEGDCEPECTAGQHEANRSAGRRGGVLLLTGVGLWIGSSIADVIFAKRAADGWNERHAITVAPTLSQHGPGFVLGGRF